MAKMKLGKGLNALIPKDINVGDRKKFMVLDTVKVQANPNQPRRIFDQKALQDLADSIKQNGILQPLIVKAQNSHFEIVAGERRFRAAQMIGLEKVPAILIEGISTIEQIQLALIENLQREDLNIMELAEGYATLINEHNLTQEELAKKVSKDRSTVANTLRLLSLPGEIKEMMRAGKISSGHARTILALESKKDKLLAAQQIIDQNISVRALESMIYGGKPKKRGRKLKLRKMPPDLAEVENQLKRFLGTKVELKRGLKKGRIEIEYYSDSDLTRIIELILST